MRFGWWIWAWLPKPRPAVVVNIPFHNNERALYSIVPNTTAIRGGRFEVVIDVPWLEAGTFDVQGLRNIPGPFFVRRLGVLNQMQMETLMEAVKTWLGLT